MALSANVRHYFLEAYTPCGHISLMPDLAAECLCTYRLAGSPGLDKSTFIKLMGIQLSDRCYDVDYIRQARDPDALAGLFLPNARICLLDPNGSFDDVISAPGQEKLTVIIDLEECLHPGKWEGKAQEIDDLLKKEQTLERQRDELLAYEYPVTQETAGDKPIQSLLGQMVNNELPHFFYNLKCTEEIYVDEMRRIMGIIKQNKVSFCFLQALQSEGWANYAPRYLRSYDRICVEDEEGSGTILHDILSEIKSLGQKIEIVLHPIYPFRVIGIIFPWKNLSVWKGNPVKLEEVGLRKHHGTQLIGVLEEMRHLRQSLKSLVHECVSSKKLDEIRNDLISDILGQIKTC